MNNSETWKKLLSPNRIKDAKKNKQTAEGGSHDMRNPFERDSDRIIYSYPFRRLQDKTQVIPLPIIDFVHTRLTHSLEVATVGRSLGRIVETFLLKEKDITSDQIGHIPSIIHAACLAHDIGNPPFGHSGEDSISDYFRNDKGFDYIEEYFHKDDEFYNSKINDLQCYEGNALGFNLLTKYEDVGLNLTCATLATFTKYPRLSYINGDSNKDNRWNNDRVSQKKYGFFVTELEEFKIVAEETGMIPLKLGNGDFSWCRHPLSFLLEAADDICYRIIDLEDGFRIKKIPFVECEKDLMPIAELDNNFKLDKYNLLTTENRKFSYLRALTINVLINKCSDVFQDKYPEILSGDFDKDLIKCIDNVAIQASISGIKNTVKKYIYISSDVLTLEAAGYDVLGGLLSEFIEASNFCLSCSEPYLSKKASKYYDLLPDEYKSKNDDYYIRYQKIANYVAGMTDSYALNLFQKVKGIKL
ncbi:dGTP triphosphohydrolase [Flavobacterium sp. LM4]|uniref:dGTP triphosphohydrolase n=1 Tax=Flavobacterium sp. LM4 TaxID=1938609 RepID=UPI0009948C22|nr:dNTP triphosphohydrolase [Flavobacterium sp. LM4]OOV18172.1 hypothetical protein BXU10_00110 [Flavobacterium sp. LM4]